MALQHNLFRKLLLLSTNTECSQRTLNFPVGEACSIVPIVIESSQRMLTHRAVTKASTEPEIRSDKIVGFHDATRLLSYLEPENILSYLEPENILSYR